MEEMHVKTYSQNQSSFRSVLSDAIHYWELRRILYNILLAVVVISIGAIFWAVIRGHLSFELLLTLLVLAVLANICYSAAYLVDVPMQLSVFRNGWRRWRALLWMFGTIFSVALACYWSADEIVPALAGFK